MQHWIRKSVWVLVAVASVCGCISPLAAQQIVILDTFTTGTPFNGTINTMNGRTPDTINLPGFAYNRAYNSTCCGQQEIDNTIGAISPSLKTGFNNLAAIRYANVVPSAAITLSIDAQLNNLLDDSDPRGVGLGFYSAVPPTVTGSAHTNFTGIVANPAGTLEFVSNGVSQGMFTTPLPGFSSSTFYDLTYTVNPTTGKLIDLDFGGVDYLNQFMAAFPAANFSVSPFAGFFGQTAANANNFGRVDNFSVAIAPEPASIAVWTLLGIGLLGFGYRRIRPM